MSEALVLPDELTIYEAAALHQNLSLALQSVEGIQADLSHIGEIDSAAVQVLIWAQREGERLGRPVRYLHPSDSVQGYLALLGLDGALRFAEDAA
jgi:ABC-type transporter Mla MlaB component